MAESSPVFSDFFLEVSTGFNRFLRQWIPVFAPVGQEPAELQCRLHQFEGLRLSPDHCWRGDLRRSPTWEGRVFLHAVSCAGQWNKHVKCMCVTWRCEMLPSWNAEFVLLVSICENIVQHCSIASSKSIKVTSEWLTSDKPVIRCGAAQSASQCFAGSGWERPIHCLSKWSCTADAKRPMGHPWGTHGAQHFFELTRIP